MIIPEILFPDKTAIFTIHICMYMPGVVIRDGLAQLRELNRRIEHSERSNQKASDKHRFSLIFHLHVLDAKPYM